MKKSNYAIIGFIGVLIVSLSATMGSATQSWIPDPDNVPGYTHHLGSNLNVSDIPIAYTEMSEIRVDFWTNDNTTMVASITVVNETNVFDQTLDPEVKAGIQTYLNALPAGVNIQLETVWDLIKLGLPIAAAFLRTQDMTEIYTDTLSSDYYEDGIVAYTNETSIALAKDGNLSIFCISFPMDQAPANQTDLEQKVNEMIININALLNSGLLPNSGLTSEPKPSDEPAADQDVLNVLNFISIQYGDPNSPNGNNLEIPGYSAVLVSVASIMAIAIIIKKRK